MLGLLKEVEILVYIDVISMIHRRERRIRVPNIIFKHILWDKHTYFGLWGSNLSGLNSSGLSKNSGQRPDTYAAP